MSLKLDVWKKSLTMLQSTPKESEKAETLGNQEAGIGQRELWTVSQLS